MYVKLILLVLLGLASVDVKGRKKGRDRRRKWPRRFPKPYSWMLYSSNYNAVIEENGCVDIRPECEKWAQLPGYCRYTKKYMKKHCRRSCKLCIQEDELSIGKTSAKANEVCEDHLNDCRKYIKTQHQCNLFSGLMKKYCPMTCGFCCHDMLTDCTLFIKKPSQCGGLNGFFRKYCPHTCQMCGFLLPIKKPGCEDELDDCKSFDLDQCQIHRSFCSRYCAKTCGFCEERVYSPEGTTQPLISDATSKDVTLENSPTTYKVIGRETKLIFQDSTKTDATPGATKPQGTPPAETAATPAGTDMSRQTTKIPHKATTMLGSMKPERLTNSLGEKSTITSEILEQTNVLNVTKTTIKTLHPTASSEIRTTETQPTNTSLESTKILEIQTDVSKLTTTTENDATVTSSPIESATQISTSGSKNSTYLSQKTTTAQAQDKPATNIPGPKSNSSGERIETTSYSTGNPTTRIPSEREETESPTRKSFGSQHFISVPSTIRRVSTVSTARSTEGIKTSTANPSVVTSVPSTPRRDDDLSSPRTLKTRTDVSSRRTVKTNTERPSSNTGNPNTEAASSSNLRPVIDVSSPSTLKSDTDFSSPSTIKTNARVSSSENTNTGASSPNGTEPAVEVSILSTRTKTDAEGSSSNTGNPNTTSSSNSKPTAEVSTPSKTDTEGSSSNTGNPNTVTSNSAKPVVKVSTPSKADGIDVSSSNTGEPNTSSSSNAETAVTPGTTKTGTRPIRVNDIPTSAKESIQTYSLTAATPVGSGAVTDNPDVIDSGFLQAKRTTTPMNTKEQNIKVVVGSPRPTTSGSPLRSKTKRLRKTGKETACEDKLKECANYVEVNINYCKYHVHFMHEYCPKSCGYCGKKADSLPKCEDLRKNQCKYYSRYAGYCTVYMKYMRKRCPKSCGFCAVAPGSAPLDRTFIKTDQKYELSIMTEWDGRFITHAPIKITLSAEDNTNVRLEVSGPLFNQPEPPPCDAGKPCWQLWDYEVAEVFFLGEKEKYLELEVSPHGPHLLLLLDGKRKPFKTKLPMRYSATKDLKSMTWNGTAIVPMDYFPPGMRKINAYAIHGPNTNKIYESLYPARKTAYPDFHRLEFFQDFDFKSMFPSSWNQPISPMWLRTK